ncbi:MAG: S8 family serine peptidase [Anaerolineae bacterium]|nr:S8 family serine peptidase [Anaerolineae bacterium]
MKRVTPAFLISIFLLISFIIFAAGPILAQEPDSSSTKGADPLPVAQPDEPALPPAQIDRTLLPKIEPQLLKKLLSQDEPVPFLVYLNSTADLSAALAAAGMGAQGEPDRLAQRMVVVNALQQTARHSQAGVLQQLTNPASVGISGQSAADIRPLWIVNAVAAKGNLPTVLALATRPDVAIVRLDKEIRLSRPVNPPLSFQPSSFQSHPSALIPHSSPEWGIAKIRADLVHNALGINGAGVVVANIDTGVDWQHALLQTKYRGYTGAGKLPLHIGNWFDATGEGATYPVDANGHGTHTMGTMVGDDGLGVAPGARWIAARAFDNSGSAYDSWLHNAFQWILAPNDNPALAPDIVNNSWSSSLGYSTEFQADVQALLAAGIYPVFSAGNDGPYEGTVGSPASLNMAFAVGATTIDDEIASFSSRGPSPWGKIKPEVSAPGKDVRSTLPGGAFGIHSGTSMAAPHAAGLAALLLQASPTLSNNLSGISAAMTSTAVLLGSPIPNNDYGWGRIDAYNAVMAVAPVGVMQGTVTRQGSGAPLSSATIQITAHSGGPTIHATSNASGFYQQGLAANTYDATAWAFGYTPTTAFGINIVTNTTTTQNFSLTLKPTGTLSGTVKEKDTNIPLAATITIDDAPARAGTNPTDGSYSLTLPIGTYTATVVAAAHRITKEVNITINEGEPVIRHFLLDPAPTILLVDSGRWYQESKIGYYQQALDDLLYPYDLHQISQPFGTPSDIPTASLLNQYDIVIWSAPEDSPGYIGADAALEDFLDNGGKLLLSGQDVAYYDGGGWIFGSAPYLQNYLKATFVEDDSGLDAVTGVGGEPFAGLSLTISGGDGADNQAFPDVIANADPDFAGSLLAYDDDKLAGLHIGLCVPYRAIYLSFGFEAINTRADRGQVMERTINWLMETPPANGVELTPPEETKVGNFGSVVSQTVRLRNTGTTTDVYTLTVTPGTPYGWPITPASLPPATLGSCQVQTITLAVQVDITNTWHVSDTLTLAAQSTNDPLLTRVVTRTTKTPAPVLLVDDDRWYSFAEEFKTALAANHIPYDYWYVPKSWSGPVPPSPPLDVLQMYPMTVWYTAYDWYQPLTTVEENRLAQYLDGGGRLFFSSQDYIYNLPDHVPGPFAINYLGVLSHTEDYSSTLTIGQPGNPVGNHLGPYNLTFPPGYHNWTDALTPTTTAQIASVGQYGQPNGVTKAGIGPGGDHWHTNFLAYGSELLVDAERARLMQRSVGWLSWLGSSTVVPSISTAVDGTHVTYTATLTNDGWIDFTAYFTATFPAELTLGTYDNELALSGDNLIWSGTIPKNDHKVLTYTATITNSLPLGMVVSQTSWLAYAEHNILFDRIADVNVNFPDLSASEMIVVPTEDVEENSVLTYTIVLRNIGLVDDPLVTTTNTVPHMLNLMVVDTPSQGTVISSGKNITWTTPVDRDEAVTLTYQAVVSYHSGIMIENTAFVDDNINKPLRLTARATYKTMPIYLPVIFKH